MSKIQLFKGTWHIPLNTESSPSRLVIDCDSKRDLGNDKAGNGIAIDENFLGVQRAALP